MGKTKEGQEARLSRVHTVALAICIGGGYFVKGVIVSLQPPLYPKEAEAKGATPSQYGFVFGIVGVASFVCAPLFAHLGHIIRPKELVIFGSITQATAGICFGFLEYVQETGPFLGLSYFLRFIEGVGSAAIYGAMISIFMTLYPKNFVKILSWTETTFGLGYSLGPAIGVFIYDLGGFKLPFIVVGSVDLVFAITIIFLIPDLHEDSSSNNEETHESSSSLRVIDIIKSPSICMPYIDNVMNFCGVGFIESMLEPHAREAAGMNSTEVGCIFFLLGSVCFVGMLITGYVCDSYSYPVIISLLGNAVMAVALLLVGPAPFLTLTPSRDLLFASGALIGFGYALTSLSTFSRANNAALAQGYTSDIKTNHVVAGIWTSTVFLGTFFGSTLGGVLVHVYGFPTTATGFVILYFIFLGADVMELGISTSLRNRQYHPV